MGVWKEGPAVQQKTGGDLADKGGLVYIIVIIMKQSVRERAVITF